MKPIAKALVSALAVALVSPLALAERLARKLLGRDVWFTTHGELLSLLPGKVGYYLRNGYYRLTLQRCQMGCQLSFGTYFTHSEAELGTSVYMGTRCLVGTATIEDEVLLADHVQILSGSRQHLPSDPLSPVQQSTRFIRVRIGKGTWIGAGAIVMADVGEHCIVGAGSVVTKPVPDFSVAVGNPARVVRSNAPVPSQV